MKCSYCDKTALYKVEARGYCGDHRAEAVKATQKYANQRRAENSIQKYRWDDHVVAGSRSRKTRAQFAGKKIGQSNSASLLKISTKRFSLKVE